MDHKGNPKLSLVAQFDDLCRYTKVLTMGCEEEFKIFTESQLNCAKKWKNAESEVRCLKEKLATLEAEKRKLETQMKHLKDICEEEVSKRKQAMKEKLSMERQLELIKDTLAADSKPGSKNQDRISKPTLVGTNNFDEQHKITSLQPARLSTIEESERTLVSVSDYDNTDDILEEEVNLLCSRQSKSKRNSLECMMSPDINKSHHEQLAAEIKRFEIYENQKIPLKKAGMRSNSEPTGNSFNTPINMQVRKSDSDQFNTDDFRSLNTSPLSSNTSTGQNSTSGKLIRTHTFVRKMVIRTEKCYPCGRNIGFCKQGLKCQDCRMICHTECEQECQVPCVPTVNVPNTLTTGGTISDYVSTTTLKIPAILVHCINEIEKRGLKEIGLYRISGSEREIKDMKDKFLRGRTVPCLNQVDIHTVCGIVKNFLRSLDEPLIPNRTWNTFVKAADIMNESLSCNFLNEYVMELPQANRDTLAFLILHLQKVAESKHCKMSIENIAKVFGPTIVGYSSSDHMNVNMIIETSKQQNVIRRLLKLSSDSWEKFLNVETDVFHVTPIKMTEIITPAPTGTRLCPTNSGNNERAITLTRTSLTSRNTKNRKSGKFFSSPLPKASPNP